MRAMVMVCRMSELHSLRDIIHSDILQIPDARQRVDGDDVQDIRVSFAT